MLSLRAFSRSIPRTLFRTSSPAIRRPISTLRKSSLLQSQSLWRGHQAFRPAHPAFSTSQAMREPAGEVDQELAVKIQSEYQLEQETMNEGQGTLKTTVQEFIDNSDFEVQDTPGQEEVVLTRTKGNEQIRVTFSIADINATAMDDDADGALFDEPDDMPTKSVNQSRTQDGNIAVAPEDQVAPSDLEETPMDEARPDSSFPARVNVQITKPGQGTLHFETVAQDGFISIEDIFYSPEGADAKTKAGLYGGPPFQNLDEDLQLLWERYLEERGINSTLATFVPDYSEYKEQREYVNWLSNAKQFVDA